MMRALIDTDVNLDFVLQRQPFFAEAERNFPSLLERRFRGLRLRHHANKRFLHRAETNRQTKYHSRRNRFACAGKSLQRRIVFAAKSLSLSDYRL